MDSGLKIRNYYNLETPFPQFTKPKMFGYFSLNSERLYEPNTSQLRYYKSPQSSQFPLDLTAGYCNVVKKLDSAYEENLDFLLKFIADNYEKHFSQYARRKTKEGSPLIGPEFVCWRGLLRLIMSAPYERREGWSIHVTKFMGTWYLCKLDTDADKYKRSNETAQQQETCSWGFKFEQYCLVESPLSEADTSQPVNECEEFSGVFRSTLAGMDMLYGAEMDGLLSETPIDLSTSKLDDLKFVELKTRLNHLHPGQRKTYLNHKTRNWWCQSFLVGVHDIYVGLRSEKGFVERIEHIDVRSLTKLGGSWKPTDCANFLVSFLRTLKRVMSNVNCPHTTYEFIFDPRTGKISYDIRSGKTRYSFMPDWYIARLKRESVSTKVA